MMTRLHLCLLCADITNARINLKHSCSAGIHLERHHKDIGLIIQKTTAATFSTYDSVSLRASDFASEEEWTRMLLKTNTDQAAGTDSLLFLRDSVVVYYRTLYIEWFELRGPVDWSSLVAQFAFLQWRSCETVARQRADIVIGFLFLFKCYKRRIVITVVSQHTNNFAYTSTKLISKIGNQKMLISLSCAGGSRLWSAPQHADISNFWILLWFKR